jgi:hypothetical protein
MQIGSLAVVRANEVLPPADFRLTFTVEVDATVTDRLCAFPTGLSQFRTRETRSRHAFELLIQHRRSKQRGPHNPDAMTDHTRIAWQFTAISGNNPEPTRLSGRTLYLLPHGIAAHRPYRVLAEALQQRGRWALGRVSMSGHRYGVVVRADDSLLSTRRRLQRLTQIQRSQVHGYTCRVGRGIDSGGDVRLR